MQVLSTAAKSTRLAAMSAETPSGPASPAQVEVDVVGFEDVPDRSASPPGGPSPAPAPRPARPPAPPGQAGPPRATPGQFQVRRSRTHGRGGGCGVCPRAPRPSPPPPPPPPPPLPLLPPSPRPPPRLLPPGRARARRRPPAPGGPPAGLGGLEAAPFLPPPGESADLLLRVRSTGAPSRAAPRARLVRPPVGGCEAGRRFRSSVLGGGLGPGEREGRRGPAQPRPRTGPPGPRGRRGRRGHHLLLLRPGGGPPKPDGSPTGRARR